MKGRKPTPTQLKILSGNPGRRPLNPREPKAKVGRPAKPRGLTEKARKAWDDFVSYLGELGVLHTVDRHAIELMAETYVEWRQHTTTLEREGTIYKAPTERGFMIRPRPEVSMRSDAARRLASLLAEFGLTPSTRSRLEINPPEELDPLQEFLARGREIRGAEE